MAVVVWIVEGTWPACVDAARTHASGDIALLHVTDVSGAAHGAFAGLLGRADPHRDPGIRLESMAAAGPLLDAAAQRLDRPCTRLERAGRIEREVIDAAQGADLLIVSRDNDHPGPKSLGPATRFVVDHAPCPVLLVRP
ncbi:nucleotide-binding universal stress UspA family protein [Kibdelosporangium banguiense]|uniref:Nucleotide-binding universal stress UspA family protein n=1 Tax=Kibdelosporangium banguiense TaxID=1365924 RepID=A0ABS4T8S6_9PSEU|nr:universal stress protein [Kibdelosporangium banguiense]MBP2320334.1 nucleotide-binding universal stress UspA family protein [Kibdelosporangium banguiense]